MRIFFVGIHNKPGKEPLASDTSTGKAIDAIINYFPGRCVKTNLCEIEYFPTDKKELNDNAAAWITKYAPGQEDVIVLLGSKVQKYFHRQNTHRLVEVRHPAGIFGTREKKQKYVEEVAKKINKLMGEMRCFQCDCEITPTDNGCCINDGTPHEMYQCNDCHYSEFGVNITGSLLVFK